MISEKDLQEAIAECQGQRNPNANTCIKLAAFLTIQKELYGSPEPSEVIEPTYSYAPSSGIAYESGSEFSKMIYGREADEIWPIMDELMDALYVVNPRLYESVLKKLQ